MNPDPGEPGCHKRVKAAAPLICQATFYLATRCPPWADDLRLLDGTPVPCGTSRQTARYSGLAGLARSRLPRQPPGTAGVR